MSQDFLKLKNRTSRRQEKWEERIERSRGNRDEADALKEQVAALSTVLAESEDGHQLPEEPTKFADLPLSSRTMQGLERGNYTHLTRIQAAALPAALAGRDILGAAKTGSGKTLTFLIPVLERLHREQWSQESGVGAIVLSPTRELALQTFKVLQVIGIRHTFSAALLTGGRNVEEEKTRVHAINVIIGTPGRVLHHMTETTGLNTDNLLLLVFDEADRLLDMGFRETIESILDQLPQPVEGDTIENGGRQTLLFSATQTRDVTSLAKLCLRASPLFITDHPTSVAPTPQKMSQNFIVIDQHRKLDLLYLFLRRHPHDKIVVFASTQNQVRFMFLAFSRLLKKTKIPAMCLTGKMKQFRREEVFLTFCRCKSAVLFCTDLAARGLDFPMVHWVVQFDCPESVQTYVHRAGRTARAGARGVSLLFLTPPETPMLSFLHHKNIPMREVGVKPHMLMDTRQMFVALAIQGLKLDAQKACVGYLRSLHFAANKAVFKLAEVDCDRFAQSLGLNAVPDLSGVTTGRSAKNLPWDVQNFMQAMKAKAATAAAAAAAAAASSGAGASGGGGEEEEETAAKTRRERHLEAADMFTSLQAAQRFNAKKAGGGSFFGDDEEDDGQGGVSYTKRRVDADADAAGGAGASKMSLTAEERMKGLSKHKMRRLVEAADLRVKDLNLNKRTKFENSDEEDVDDTGGAGRGPAVHGGDIDALDMEVAPAPRMGERDQYLQQLQTRVKSATADDKQLFREKKFQLLEKKGKVKPKEDAADEDEDDEDDVYGDFSSDEDVDREGDDEDEGSDDDFDELMRAARGELYEDDDDEDDDEDDGEEDNDADDEVAEEVYQPASRLNRNSRAAHQQQQRTTATNSKRGAAVASSTSTTSSKNARKRKFE